MTVIFFGLASSVLTFILGGLLWTLVLLILMVMLVIAALVRTLNREHVARVRAETKVGVLEATGVNDIVTVSEGQSTQSGTVVDESDTSLKPAGESGVHSSTDEPTGSVKGDVVTHAAQSGDPASSPEIDTKPVEDPVQLAYQAALRREPKEVERLLTGWVAEVDPPERVERESLLVYYRIVAGQTAQVTELYRLADANPSAGVIALRLALALDVLGEKRQAADELAARLPVVNPKQALRLQEARLRRSVGEPAVALALAQTVLNDSGVSGARRHDALVEEGYALEALGRMHEALGAFEKALEIDPSNASLRFHVAYEYSQLKLQSLALAHYEALESQGETGVTINNLGAALHDLGLPMLGTDYYLRAAKQGVAIACGNLASRLLDAGFIEEAERWITEGEKLDPTNPRVTGAAARVQRERETESSQREDLLSEGLRLRAVIRSFDARVGVALPGGRFVTETGDVLNFQIEGEVSKAKAANGWEFELRPSETLLAVSAKKGLFTTNKADGFCVLHEGELIGYVKGWPIKGRVGVLKATLTRTET